MNLISLNAWGGRLYKPLIQYLHKTLPDVICLQEVYCNINNNNIFSLIDKTWDSDCLPVRLNLLQEILNILDDYNHLFCPSYRKIFYTEEDQTVSSLFGNLILTKKHLTIIDYKEKYIYEKFLDVSQFDKNMPRKAQCVRLRSTHDGTTIVVANIHGRWIGQKKNDTVDVVKQGNKISDLVKSVKQDSDNIIICGDFNVQPDSNIFKTLLHFNVVNLININNINSTRTS